MEKDKRKWLQQPKALYDGMQPEVLIIRKTDATPMAKNIGRMFRGHDIVMYKRGADYLSVNDFYHVYGYACFYKSDTLQQDGRKAENITITLVSDGYPKNLLSHLTWVRGLETEKQEDGIYSIKGDVFGMQLLVTTELSEEQNLWLKNLMQTQGDAKRD